ncbi:MAG: hypothetical protein ABI577_11805 [bacterium]
MTAAPRRRNNAPLRPRRKATTVPDVLFALGMALLVMATIFFIASFVDENLSNGDAGTVLARAFAGTLAVSALFAFLLGILLLRSDRNQLDHYVAPLLIGGFVGAIEGWLFLAAQPPVFLLVPLLLLVFSLRPLRRALSRRFLPRQSAR